MVCSIELTLALFLTDPPVSPFQFGFRKKNLSVKYESDLRIFSRHFCIALHCRKSQQLILAWRHCEHGHSANVSRCRRQAELLLAVAARRDSDASALAGDTC